MGTALAISLVMVMIMLFQIKVANYVPEINRDHLLFISSVRFAPREGVDGYTNNTGATYELARDYLYQMETPQVTSAFSYIFVKHVSVPTKELYSEYSVRATDLNYWKVYDFDFVEGTTFDEGEYKSGLKLAIISQEVAQIMFGDESAIGKTINISLQPHRVAGVVKDVSRLATDAFAHVWIPLTSEESLVTTQGEGNMGSLQICFLFRDKENKAAIREELAGAIKKFSDNKERYVVTAESIDYIQKTFRTYWKPDAMQVYLLQGILMILFILLLPAINLTGITMNNIRQRSSEIAIRKAFGASKGTLMWQILMENLVLTAIGALIGYLLSFVFIQVGRGFLLSSNTLLTMDMLLRPFGFIAAIVFCLLMNLLSAGLPAWRMSRRTVVESLSNHES